MVGVKVAVFVAVAVRVGTEVGEEVIVGTVTVGVGGVRLTVPGNGVAIPQPATMPVMMK